MYRIAVIGDRDSIYGFAALGLDVVFVEPEEDALSKIRKVCTGKYAVVYVTEALALAYEKEFARYASSALPAVIPIPGAYGNTGMGMTNVRRSVEKAVGSDILFND
ncbi:MAG TPA: V-type ATP synthase subunit F [Candidatus Scatavimonas merdigallinarum]|uniref:V-type ATP synthase subunit F n=1 Tax=Candidatus Scatavimonas merdigallinarum TaxID=2840914 RepID=A0A9D0ZH13_9FIRM|nr:V-type ATP synthase subunit F [Acutalibacteraceae bacterium]HIQ80215.1 V-type ATP synthase subunit F [Candidatus Scatavimonas merdigallinarum]HIR03993.1 V-type ATP synthase subunit F [Candidatus Scatovicinus merdipullorum]